MKKGRLVSGDTSHIARAIGVIAPIILFFYGWLVYSGLGDTAYFIGLWQFLAITIAWAILGVWQYVKPAKTMRQQAVVLAIYHLFATLYVLCVGGFTAALITGWALLSLISYLHFKYIGFSISVCILVFITALDPLLHTYTTPEVVITYLNTLLTIMVASAAVAIAMTRPEIGSTSKKDSQQQDAEQERILTIVNNLADAIFVTDMSGRITIFNAAALNLLDTNSSINDKLLSDVFTLSDEEGNTVNLFKRIKETHSVTIDDTLRMKAGDEAMRLEFTYAPIKSSYSNDNTSGDKEGYIIIARDVTRLKSLEEERDEFISVVSHELRTPIAVAEGTISNVQLMIERGKSDENKVNESLEEAHDQVIYLAKMINDLSTLSRAERGVAAETELIDVAELAHDLYSEYSPEATKQKLHFNLELAPHVGHVNTSRLYLHELLQNFITNAIKYTREGSITLKIDRTDDTVHFLVSDTGIGISKTDQDKIFNKFYRSEDFRTRETGGTGLGLYVAMKLSKKVGTAITLKSRLNHGSTFGFDLPAHHSQPVKKSIAIH